MRQIVFTSLVLLIQVPLGVAVALAMPRRGPGVSMCLVLMALPLLIPWNVVGAMWNIYRAARYGSARPDDQRARYRLQLHAATAVGVDHRRVDGCVALDLAGGAARLRGLCAIPDAYYQAAKIDGASAWEVFRYIQLPKMKRVLTIAVLLRFMDSFMIYTEPFVLTGGGPGNATTFLSIDLVKIALGQFDLGPAAAMSIIYFLDHPGRVLAVLHLMMRSEGEP